MSTPDFRLFWYNGRGFSFEVEQTCYAAKTPMNCDVLFNNTTNVVTQFGTFGQKQFQPDPDIAGIGVSCCVFVPKKFDGQEPSANCI